MANPVHPDCPLKSDRPSHKHSRSAFGKQRYRCPICKKTWMLNPGNRWHGDRAAVPMTDAERQQKRRKKLRN